MISKRYKERKNNFLVMNSYWICYLNNFPYMMDACSLKLALVHSSYPSCQWRTVPFQPFCHFPPHSLSEPQNLLFFCWAYVVCCLKCSLHMQIFPKVLAAAFEFFDNLGYTYFTFKQFLKMLSRCPCCLASPQRHDSYGIWTLTYPWLCKLYSLCKTCYNLSEWTVFITYSLPWIEYSSTFISVLFGLY